MYTHSRCSYQNKHVRVFINATYAVSVWSRKCAKCAKLGELACLSMVSPGKARKYRYMQDMHIQRACSRVQQNLGWKRVCCVPKPADSNVQTLYLYTSVMARLSNISPVKARESPAPAPAPACVDLTVLRSSIRSTVHTLCYTCAPWKKRQQTLQ